MNKIYKIEPVKTSKDAIQHPKLSEEGVIPKLCCSTVLVGKSGSGKSVLLQNLMTRKEFFAGHFDKVFLISPTGEADDVQKALNVSPNCVFTDMVRSNFLSKSNIFYRTKPSKPWTKSKNSKKKKSKRRAVAERRSSQLFLMTSWYVSPLFLFSLSVSHNFFRVT